MLSNHCSMVMPPRATVTAQHAANVRRKLRDILARYQPYSFQTQLSFVAMESQISSIVADSLEVKRRYFAEHAAEVEHAAKMIADAFSKAGKLLLLGNGGSA